MNLTIFFDAARISLFSGAMTPKQVGGCEAILAAFDGCDVRWQAYALATALHETARTMQPIKEYGGDDYFFRMYDPFGDRPALAKSMGNTKRGDG
jgi:putative chitinase